MWGGFGLLFAGGGILAGGGLFIGEEFFFPGEEFLSGGVPGGEGVLQDLFVEVGVEGEGVAGGVEELFGGVEGEVAEGVFACFKGIGESFRAVRCRGVIEFGQDG